MRFLVCGLASYECKSRRVRPKNWQTSSSPRDAWAVGKAAEGVVVWRDTYDEEAPTKARRQSQSCRVAYCGTAALLRPCAPGSLSCSEGWPPAASMSVTAASAMRCTCGSDKSPHAHDRKSSAGNAPLCAGFISLAAASALCRTPPRRFIGTMPGLQVSGA